MTGPIKSEWAKFAQTNPTSVNANFRQIFAFVAKYFDTHSGFQRIASNYGVGGDGIGFRTEGVNLRGGAFAVWRSVSGSLATGAGEPEGIPPFDLVLALGDADANLNATSSWLPGAATGVWYTLAWHSSSAAWNGTTANNGQDNWSTTPWKSGSIVLAKVNGSGSFASASLNGLSRLDYGDNLPPADAFITGDNDTISVAFRSPPNAGPNAQINQLVIFGGYQRLTSSINVPLFNYQFSTAFFAPWVAQGTTISDPNDAGIATSSSIGVKKIVLDYPNGWIKEITEGDGAGSLDSFETHANPDIQDRYVTEWPLIVAVGEWNGGVTPDNFTGSHFVLAGVIPNIRVMGLQGRIARFYNNYSRVALGWSNSGGTGNYDPVISLPWNSASITYKNY